MLLVSLVSKNMFLKSIRQVMRITVIETSPAEAYSYVRSILQNSYSLLNGKLEHHE